MASSPPVGCAMPPGALLSGGAGSLRHPIKRRGRWGSPAAALPKRPGGGQRMRPSPRFSAYRRTSAAQARGARRATAGKEGGG